MGSSPYDGFDAAGYLLDILGWKSEHPYFEAIIPKTRRHTILEVGTWKGASAIRMATSRGDWC
jgi:predicted O-methyltransferase YrrM